MRIFLGFLILAFSTPASSGDAENISACVNKAKEFSGVSLDAFAVIYKGNVVSMSTAKWQNAFCEVKIADVYNLQVNGKTYIYKGYAGKGAYDLNTALQEKTDEAISQMRARISLLELRSSQVSASLRKPNPDHKWLTRYIDEGIQKSSITPTGKQR